MHQQCWKLLLDLRELHRDLLMRVNPVVTKKSLIGIILAVTDRFAATNRVQPGSPV